MPSLKVMGMVVGIVDLKGVATAEVSGELAVGREFGAEVLNSHADAKRLETCVVEGAKINRNPAGGDVVPRFPHVLHREPGAEPVGEHAGEGEARNHVGAGEGLTRAVRVLDGRDIHVSAGEKAELESEGSHSGLLVGDDAVAVENVGVELGSGELNLRARDLYKGPRVPVGRAGIVGRGDEGAAHANTSGADSYLKELGANGADLGEG